MKSKAATARKGMVECERHIYANKWSFFCIFSSIVTPCPLRKREKEKHWFES